MLGFIKNVFASAIGFFVGMLLIVLFFAAVVGSIAGSIEETPDVKENTILELKLNGEIADRSAEDPLTELGLADESLSPVGLNAILYGMDKASKDKNIKGILLRTDLYAGSMGTAEEIRDKIIQFRKSGKFAIAYGEIMTDAGYYIATACDKIYLNPKGILEFNGFAGQTALYKGMFDKIGLEFEVFKAGKYKSAVEPFIQEKISDANREQIKQYVFELFGHCMRNIAIARRSDSASIADIANTFKARNAKAAKQYNLVDALTYEDELEAQLKTLVGAKKGAKLNLMNFGKYAKNSWIQGEGKQKIALIYAEGDINMGKNESGDGIGSESMAATIKKARLDTNIKAIVLRVNSPGGSSHASDIIAREIELTKKVKPVIASFGGVSASGGYYIACMADSIFAQPTSITGSIGVFALLPNTAKMYKEKLGLTYETIPTGEFAVTWRPDQPLSAGMRQYFQEMVNDIYGDFIGIVAKGRKMDTSMVRNLAEGHVYTGIHAKQIGLIDGFGGMQRAISSAAAKARLNQYRIVSMPVQKSAIERLFGPQTQTKAKEQWMKEEMGILFEGYQQAKSALTSQGVYMRMPFNLSIQ